MHECYFLWYFILSWIDDWFDLPNLKEISFGSRSCINSNLRIERNYQPWFLPSYLHFIECPRLESAEFKENAFTTSKVMKLKNLESLKSLSFGKRCFRAMRSIEIDSIFYLFLWWLLDLPNLETVERDSPAKRPRGQLVITGNIVHSFISYRCEWGRWNCFEWVVDTVKSHYSYLFVENANTQKEVYSKQLRITLHLLSAIPIL